MRLRGPAQRLKVARYRGRGWACLVESEDLTTLVPKLKRSRTSLQTDEKRLARLVREHLGSDILSQVQARPRWMDNIAADREKMECRYQRQPA